MTGGLSELGEAALSYARRGLNVLPLKPREKVPDGAFVSHGLLQATHDLVTVEGWWRASPDDNVGIRTGLTFDVLDVDDGGWKSLSRLAEENGCLPSGPVALTARGGHYWFKATGESNRTAFLPGLDWKGSRGYIVAPPSVHPSGTVYEWVIPLDEIELPEGPSWLVDLLRKPPAPIVAMAPVALTRGSNYAKAALRDECEGVAAAPVGTRNHKLNVASFSAGTLIGARLLDPDEAAEALLAAAAVCGLPEPEARSTIASGLKAGFYQPRRVAS
jgi:hypothetical protein